MKKREIEVWVHRGIIRHDGETQSVFTIGHGDNVRDLETRGYIRGSLKLELPEKKIEITESQFDEVVMEFFPFAYSSGIAGPTWQYLKQKLFGDSK